MKLNKEKPTMMNWAVYARRLKFPDKLPGSENSEREDYNEGRFDVNLVRTQDCGTLESQCALITTSDLENIQNLKHCHVRRPKIFNYKDF